MATIAPRRQEDAEAKKPVVNFSRLRRVTGGSRKDEKEVEDGSDLEALIKASYNDDDRNVHSIQAFYKSKQGEALPDEPRFSTRTLSTISQVTELQDTSRRDSQTLPDEPVFFEEDSPTSTPTAELSDTSNDSIGEPSDSSNDSRIVPGSISELPDTPSTASSTSPYFRRQDRQERPTTKPTKPTKAAPSQTPPLKSILRKPPTHNRTNTSASSDTISPPSSSSSITPLKSILKHTTVEQYSEAGEDDGSHHTVSEGSTSRNGSVHSSGKWSSSDFDTSQLSEKQLKKLEKKGINPALYLEMKAARGGKKSGPFGGLGSLTGNAYVS